jgi:hypothetical protein
MFHSKEAVRKWILKFEEAFLHERNYPERRKEREAIFIG